MAKRNKQRRAYLKQVGYYQGYINVTQRPQKLIVDPLSSTEEKQQEIEKFIAGLRARGRTEKQIKNLVFLRFERDDWLNYYRRTKSLTKLETQFIPTTEREFEETGKVVKPIRVQRPIPKTRDVGSVRDPETGDFRIVSIVGTPRHDVKRKQENLARKEVISLRQLWASSDRAGHGINEWHFIKWFDCGDMVLKLFFHQETFIWVEERHCDGYARRSYTYHTKQRAVKALNERRIVWVERIPLSGGLTQESDDGKEMD